MNATKTVIASRTTFDGKTVDLWSDGAMTTGTGRFIKGAGAARNEQTRSANVRAGFKVFGDIAAYNLDEVAVLVAKARRLEV